MITYKKEVLRPRAGNALTALYILLSSFLCAVTAGGVIWTGFKAYVYFAPVAYAAPIISLKAPVDACEVDEYLVYSGSTWVCEKSEQSGGYNATTNVAMFLNAEGADTNYDLVAGSGTTIGEAAFTVQDTGSVTVGNSSDDTTTITGRLIVNGVDITPLPRRAAPLEVGLSSF